METKVEIQRERERERSWKAVISKYWALKTASREEEIGQGYQCP